MDVVGNILSNNIGRFINEINSQNNIPDYLPTNKTNPIETAAENIIRDEASKRGQIIHGTRALNQQVPAYLKRKQKTSMSILKKQRAQLKEL